MCQIMFLRSTGSDFRTILSISYLFLPFNAKFKILFSLAEHIAVSNRLILINPKHLINLLNLQKWGGSQDRIIIMINLHNHAKPYYDS